MPTMQNVTKEQGPKHNIMANTKIKRGSLENGIWERWIRIKHNTEQDPENTFMDDDDLNSLEETETTELEHKEKEECTRQQETKQFLKMAKHIIRLYMNIPSIKDRSFHSKMMLFLSQGQKFY